MHSTLTSGTGLGPCAFTQHPTVPVLYCGLLAIVAFFSQHTYEPGLPASVAAKHSGLRLHMAQHSSWSATPPDSQIEPWAKSRDLQGVKHQCNHREQRAVLLRRWTHIVIGSTTVQNQHETGKLVKTCTKQAIHTCKTRTNQMRAFTPLPATALTVPPTHWINVQFAFAPLCSDDDDDARGSSTLSNRRFVSSSAPNFLGTRVFPLGREVSRSTPEIHPARGRGLRQCHFNYYEYYYFNYRLTHHAKECSQYTI